MPDALRTAYGGPLAIPLRPDRATILMNFVSTLDGIVALGPGEQAGGGVISGHNEADRFVMALLRAVADVVLMGAGTIAGGQQPSVDRGASRIRRPRRRSASGAPRSASPSSRPS